MDCFGVRARGWVLEADGLGNEWVEGRHVLPDRFTSADII